MPPLWIADQVRNDVTVLVGVGLVFTLTFDSSPIKGEGILSVGVGLLLAPRCGFPPTRE